MTIEELLTGFGLSRKDMGLLRWEINNHNKSHPESEVPLLELKEGIDQVMINQAPFIGKAIARVKGEHFLDNLQMYPLEISENATLYAMHKLEKYYGKLETPEDGQAG